jgi:ACS family pantothenate transporter-like MFS transporter
LVWFQQIHQPNGSSKLIHSFPFFHSILTLFAVTPGNKGAAVVAGLNVIVFAIIAILAHREKVQKKRNGILQSPATILDSETQSTDDGNEKSNGVEKATVTVRDEEIPPVKKS